MYQYSSVNIDQQYRAQQRLPNFRRGGDCCQQVEATLIICFVDQIMDKRFVMHYSSYIVGCFRG